jgi:predicted acyl esterase
MSWPTAALIAAIGLLGGARAAAASTTVSAHGSAEQVYITGLSPQARMSLLDARGRVVTSKSADAEGGLLFRNVKPGGGYRVRLDPAGPASDPVTVFSTRPAPPNTRVYDQSIPPSGYDYLTTRDGTKLAIYVHPPVDVAKALLPGLNLPQLPLNGPWPTLIEYSGYGYADPAGPQNGIATIANALGFAVVDVNMRGTGCSGGAFDFFEALQNLDGYDVIETIARQPWVAHHKVGMMGISYGGISQMFTAQTDPPDLAAIAPLSVLDQTATVLYPGGLLNTGFAVPYAKERQHDALPASPTGGQTWAYQRIQDGDVTCKANQVLHGEAANLLAKIRANTHYTPRVADPLAPTTFVHKIDVPVFMACQWTDEETGGHCPALAEHFTGTQRKWFTFTNGTHIDSLDPATFNRWLDFLELYVARQSPLMAGLVAHAASPLVYQVAMGINGVSLPPDPIQQQPTYTGALSAYEKLPSIRVLFDNGAGGKPYFPYPGFEQSWSQLPIPRTAARYWYFSRGGALSDRRPSRAQVNRFTWNAHALPLTDFSGGSDSGTNGLWTTTPTYHWPQDPPHTGLSYVSAPLKANTVVVGAGAVHVWLRSSKPNVDLQATISEVRPDGQEEFVQNGWVRGNERKLDRHKSTLLEPVLSLRKKDVSALPKKRFVEVTIPLYYEGHAYRAGSRVRVTIAAPNGTQPVWSFSATRPHGSATVAVTFSRKMPSSLILPVVPGVSVPTPLPACPGLRGEPCRTYQAFVNDVAPR